MRPEPRSPACPSNARASLASLPRLPVNARLSSGSRPLEAPRFSCTSRPSARGLAARTRRRELGCAQCPETRLAACHCRPPCSHSPTARSFIGNSIGAAGPHRRRSGVQHRAHRLPGNPHRSELLPADRHADLPAHRQLRRQRRRRRSRQGASPPAWSSRTCRCARRTSAARLTLSRVPAARGHGGDRRHRHAQADAAPAHAAARRTAASSALPPATRSRPRAIDEAIAAARGAPSMAGLDLAKVVSRARALRVDRDRVARSARGYGAQTRAALPRRGLRLRRQAQHPAHAGRARLPRHGGAGADAGGRGAGAASPTASSSANGPGDPEPCDYAIAATRELIERGMPTFGICLGHQIMALASGAQDLQDEVRPPRRQPPGEGPRQRPRQHHQPEPRLRGRREVAAGQRCGRRTCQPVRRHAAGPGAHRQAGVLLPGPPGGLARAARHRLPVRPLRRADGRRGRSEHAQAHRPAKRS